MQALTIYVPVICTDCTVEINISPLLKHEYFNTLFNTNIGSHKITTDKVNINDKLTRYIFDVPHIAVDCSMKIFNILLDEKPYEIKSYDDDLIELLLCNDMYMMNKSILMLINNVNITTLLNFIKQKLPNNDPFDILKRGANLFDYKFFMANSFELASNGLLDDGVVLNLLHYIKQELLNDYSLECYRLCTLDVAITYYKDNSEIITSQINNHIVLSMLDMFHDHYVEIIKNGKLFRREHNDILSQYKYRIQTLNSLGLINNIDLDKYTLQS